MILTEETTVPDTDLPLAAFKAHLRLGNGFGQGAEADLQDDALKGFLRAALAAVEARTGKILFERDFLWRLSFWRDPARQVLPMAPVVRVDAVRLIDRAGQSTVLAPELYRLEADAQHPALCPAGATLPVIGRGGSAEVRFCAGMAPDWDSLPADIAQAVLMLAAHYFEYRHETGLSDGCMPFGVTSLLQRYRPVRIGFGGMS